MTKNWNEDEEDDGKDDDVDAQPELGEVLDSFAAHDYDLWDAIFELVDNSFDSFNRYKSKLKKAKGEQWTINIDLDQKDKTLTISDNAYGMNRKTLEHAVLLAKGNIWNDGVGKYGMGLKTASSWFGKKWTVKTKRLGSKYEFTATVDIKKLIKTHSNKIPIKRKIVSNLNDSYTVVTINHGIRSYGSSTQAKTKQKLAKAYRRFLANDKLVVNWKGSPLSYKEPEILTEKKGGKEIKWEYKIKPFKLKGRTVKGRYGIYKPMGKGSGVKSQVSHAGVTAFWRNRVIITRDRNWWPKKIYSDAAGDHRRQRVFLHLDLDLDPNALKKDFMWDHYSKEMLENAIIEQTNKHIIEVAKYAHGFKSGSGTISPGQRTLSDSKTKDKLEDPALSDALREGSIAARKEAPKIDKDQAQKLKDSDPNILKVAINQGEPNVNVILGEQHATEPFLSTILHPEEIDCFINPKHPFMTEKIGGDTNLYNLYIDFCISLALAQFSAMSSNTPVEPDRYLATLDRILRGNS